MLSDDLGLVKISGKELSYNNYNDIFAGLEILSSEKKIPTTVVIIAYCGVATNKSPLQSFKSSKSMWSVSAFWVLYVIIRLSTVAKEMSKTFLK